MLPLNQHVRAALLIGIGLLATCARARDAAASGPGGGPNAVSATVPVGHATVPITPVPSLDCVTGTAYPDFDPIADPTNTSAYLNVGAFFDRNRRSTVEHYFVKYFEPPTPGRYRIEGFSLRAFANTGSDVLTAAGVVKTLAASPVFPTTDELVSLQVLRVDGRGTGTDACVDLAPYDVDLESGEAAWLVVQFPDAAHFIGVLVDVNQVGNTDRGGDYLTRNGGQLWYRPDPTQTPTYDWAFTPYVVPLTRKLDVAWGPYKHLYR